ncbi:MAG: CBS domain-containing protein [Acidimicrobiales bacterium]|nr:CBS domain-containing protein [Acidimicrobiales bacterium]
MAASVEAGSAANKGGMQAPVQRYLAGVVATVSADASVRDVARKLMAIEAGALVVGTAETVQGVISERDVVRALGLGRDLDALCAGDVARTDVIYCTPATTMGELSALMTDQGVRHVLVRDETRLVGIVSARDVLHAHTG